MFQSSTELHFEVTPISGASEKDLDLFLLNGFLSDYRSISLDGWTETEQHALLENLSLITPTGQATVLGMLLFGKNPSRFLPGSHHILVYAGAKRAVVIPEYSEVDVDVIKNNMRTVGMIIFNYLDANAIGDPMVLN